MKKETQAADGTTKPDHVLVTFGRGCAELKRNFDQLVEEGGYTKAGLALALIREGVERRMGRTATKAR